MAIFDAGAAADAKRGRNGSVGRVERWADASGENCDATAGAEKDGMSGRCSITKLRRMNGR